MQDRTFADSSEKLHDELDVCLPQHGTAASRSPAAPVAPFKIFLLFKLLTVLLSPVQQV